MKTTTAVILASALTAVPVHSVHASRHSTDAECTRVAAASSGCVLADLHGDHATLAPVKPHIVAAEFEVATAFA
jgi:hypothetical protein